MVNFEEDIEDYILSLNMKYGDPRVNKNYIRENVYDPITSHFYEIKWNISFNRNDITNYRKVTNDILSEIESIKKRSTKCDVTFNIDESSNILSLRFFPIEYRNSKQTSKTGSWLKKILKQTTFGLPNYWILIVLLFLTIWGLQNILDQWIK